MLLYEHLKVAGLFIISSFILVVNLMSLSGVALVDMYAKCGSIEDAWRVFKKMPSQSVVTGSTMILGHVKCGQGQKALGLFQQMQQEGVQTDSVVGVLKACASMVAIEEGRCVHQDIIESGLESDVFVGRSLVNMYAKRGSMEDALRVFNKSYFREQCFVKENTEPFRICRNVVFSTWNLQN